MNNTQRQLDKQNKPQRSRSIPASSKSPTAAGGPLNFIFSPLPFYFSFIVLAIADSLPACRAKFW